MRSSYGSSQIAQQFINCCAFYEFTKCAAQFINCANSQIAPNTAEKTTITAITTKMARASASDYNLQISQVDWAQFFKHFWLYADLFQSVAVQSPPTIASIFIFDVIADKVQYGCRINRGAEFLENLR